MEEQKRYTSGYTPEQKRAADARFCAQIHRVGVQIPAAAWDQVEQYAAARGESVGACLKACLARCMELDGAGSIPLTVRAAKSAAPDQGAPDQTAPED